MLARTRAGRGGRVQPRAVWPLPFTHLDKVYWPDEGYTKGDLIDYYREISAFILPYLKDRPLSLNRHPDGIAGMNFFQKDVSRQPPPPWVQTLRLPSGNGAVAVTYAICQNEDTLLYLVNLGCIEMNPWLSRAPAIERPDFLVIDLDPQDVPFARAVEAALALRKLLDRADVPSRCKTSGKRGLHVCVPLGAWYEFEQARQFGEILANLVHSLLPDSTSVVRPPTLRPRRVYLDYLQNRRAQTLAAPYSARPHPGATVSAPMQWTEVRRGLDPARFTIRTIPRRLARVGDLWSPVLGPGIDLADSLDRLKRRAG